MIRGIYTSSAGMLCETIRQEIIANNLANVDTVGFKTDVAIFKELPTMELRRMNDTPIFPPHPFKKAPLIGQIGTGSVLDETYTNFEAGRMQYTGNKLDVAIEDPNAFFLVESENGSIKYSRDGVFTLNEEGFLTNMSGDYLLSYGDAPNLEGNTVLINEDGSRAMRFERIQLGGHNVSVDASGRVLLDNQEQAQLVTGIAADRKAFRKEGSNKFIRAYGEVTASQTGFNPGYVEKPNVSVVDQMVKMVEVSRAYEANSKSVQSHDTLLDKAINTVGASRR